MRLDLALKQSRMITDIKTIGEPDIKKVVSKTTGNITYKDNCWEDLKASLPKEDHKLQVGFYLYFAEVLKLFPVPFETGGVSYINTRMGNTDNKFETSFPYTRQMHGIIGQIVDNCSRHRRAWIDAVEDKTKSFDIPCQYHYCPVHGGTQI